jgi:hypothetical protein
VRYVSTIASIFGWGVMAAQPAILRATASSQSRILEWPSE